MSDEQQKSVGRRTLLAGMGVMAAAGLATGSSPASAQTPSSGFQPARHDQDKWMDELPGNHRVFVDSSTTTGGGSALWYANNIISAHEEAYDGKASDYAMIVCFRHMSTPYGFNDAIWAKYGALLNRNADPAPTSNPMSQPGPTNGGNSIASSVERGMHFAICGRATRRFAGMLAQATNGSADEIYAELLANGIPNSHFVAAGVLAATRAQEYRYSLLYAE
ncbi:hypothetical protein [Pseudohongiella spirulinae]|uniref:Tat pathway signal protein n=1 Tax=Pseudohongiella spirulinae TaxID=1249552 RepID=A0A0S2KCA8_9GAMM|nr:hypothetical protein [Pseudohongiella spirulinae]ALO45960.1 hypothetical protein PS2015_1302 [Pseudohongiella spirulinae]